MANRFLNNISINDQYTLPASDGSSNQVLATNGSGQLSFVDQTGGTSETAERIEVTVKNVSGGSLSKGTVVHASPSANPPNGNVIEVIAADYDDSAKMPAIGILNETIADTAEGSAVMMGAVSGIDTSSFSIGDELYVGNLGTLTNTKPATAGQLIQKIAVVIKSHASNGLIKIFGAGRSNDVPLPLYIDNTNQRVGIGEPSPATTLHVNGRAVIGANNTIGSSFVTHTNIIGRNNNTADTGVTTGTSVILGDGDGGRYGNVVISERTLKLGTDDNVSTSSSNTTAILDINNSWRASFQYVNVGGFLGYFPPPTSSNEYLFFSANSLNSLSTSTFSAGNAPEAAKLEMEFNPNFGTNSAGNASNALLLNAQGNASSAGALYLTASQNNTTSSRGIVTFDLRHRNNNYEPPDGMKMFEITGGWGRTKFVVESGGQNNEASIGIQKDIFHLDDTDTFFSFTAADTFGVTTGGTERLSIGNSGATFSGSVTGSSFVKSGGTSSQFLKADGSVDSSTYLTAHPNISGATSQNNSGNGFIQDLTFDSNGHVTGVVSASVSGFLTSESDTLASVTGRGSSTSTNVTLSGNGNHFSGHHYFDSYDSNGNHYPHYLSGSSNNGAQVNLRVQQSGSSNYDVLLIQAGSNNITWRGNKIWNAANDGTGSGLDADLLDGAQGGSYLRSDAHDTFTGKLSVGSTSSRSAGIYGIYDSTKTGHIWSMGTAYAIPNDGSDFGGLYGLAYKHTNNSTGGTMGGSHQMVWCDNGSPRGSIGYNAVWHAESMKAPIFYDSNNTGYYINPSSTGIAAYLRGDIEIINEQPLLELNDYTATNNTNLNCWVSFQRNATEAGYVGYGSSSTDYLYLSNFSGRVSINGTFTEHANSSRAPIFYDTNDTNYYLDANSTSRINQINYTRLDAPSSTNDARWQNHTSWGSLHQTTDGYIQLGPANTSHAHIYTDRSNFYFNKQIQLLGGSLINQSDIRSNIFYDLDNTGYYVNPAGTSVFNALAMTARFDPDDPDDYVSSTITGLTNAPIYYPESNVGTSNVYVPHTHSRTRYSSGYRAHIATGVHALASSWNYRYYIAQGGNDSYPTKALEFDVYNNNIYHSDGWVRIDGSTRSPIFYDSDNTGYYVNPAGTSVMNDISNGSSNGAISYGYDVSSIPNTIGVSNWFRSSGSTGWYNGSYGGGIYMNDTTWIRTYNNKKYYTGSTSYDAFYTAGGVRASTQMRSPIYYDENNTTYYVDPSTTGDSIRVAGDVVAFYSSDKRYKENIKPIESPIEKVKAISGVTFEWNEKSHKETGKKDVGVIAQEVEEVLPEIVQTRDNGYKAVDYQKLTAVLIEAVKEQQKQIDELKSIINGSS